MNWRSATRLSALGSIELRRKTALDASRIRRERKSTVETNPTRSMTLIDENRSSS
jgi:hypothetical protein